MDKIVNYSNSIINMFSIRTDSNGDFVFDVVMTKSEDKLSEKISVNIVVPYQSNIDNLVDYYSQVLGQKKEYVRQVLDEIHEFGREGFFERHKDEVEFENYNILDEINSTTIWNFKVYKDV